MTVSSLLVRFPLRAHTARALELMAPEDRRGAVVDAPWLNAHAVLSCDPPAELLDAPARVQSWDGAGQLCWTESGPGALRRAWDRVTE